VADKHWESFGGQLTDTWLTPPDILARLGEFDTDPCCPPKMPWRTAKTMISFPADGLALPWTGRVWLNPPYGVGVGRWLRRLYKHGNGLALIFARTETAWFKDGVWDHADAVLFLYRRIAFRRPDGRVEDKSGKSQGNASGSPSVLVAYGAENVETLRGMGDAGKFIVLNA
jgi:hypothetical protein